MKIGSVIFEPEMSKPTKCDDHFVEITGNFGALVIYAKFNHVLFAITRDYKKKHDMPLPYNSANWIVQIIEYFGRYDQAVSYSYWSNRGLYKKSLLNSAFPINESK